jgi:hypothetical protein
MMGKMGESQVMLMNENSKIHHNEEGDGDESNV